MGVFAAATVMPPTKMSAQAVFVSAAHCGLGAWMAPRGPACLFLHLGQAVLRCDVGVHLIMP